MAIGDAIALELSGSNLEYANFCGNHLTGINIISSLVRQARDPTTN
jgi:uncharacterized protein YjbI with pentapeptide repeats